MNSKAMALSGVFILMYILAGCGFTTAPVELLDSAVLPRDSVIYGEDSIRNVVKSLEVNDNATVAIVSKERWENFSKKNLFFTVNEAYVGVEKFKWSDDPSLSFCSGVLVDRNKILTAGHCFSETEQCQNSLIVFNYQKGQKVHDMQAFPCERVIARKNLLEQGLDYALIQFLGEATQTPVSVHNRTLKTAPKDPIYAMGHPLGSYKKIAQGHIRSVDPRTGVILAPIDVFEGNSGSPVFSAQTKDFIGILSSGESDFENPDLDFSGDAVKLCDDNGCSGEYIIPIEKILADIPK